MDRDFHHMDHYFHMNQIRKDQDNHLQSPALHHHFQKMLQSSCAVVKGKGSIPSINISNRRIRVPKNSKCKTITNSKSIVVKKATALKTPNCLFLDIAII